MSRLPILLTVSPVLKRVTLFDGIKPQTIGYVDLHVVKR
jgi:hypothetical protein